MFVFDYKSAKFLGSNIGQYDCGIYITLSTDNLRFNFRISKRKKMNVPGASYTYQYQRPAVTVDVVAFAVFDCEIKVALIVRGTDPYKGYWALPGGHADPGLDNFGEPIIQAAIRELEEEVGIRVDPIQLKVVGVYDTPRRDPRGWYISHAFSVCFDNVAPEVQAGDDAAHVRWVPVHEVNLDNLAFDHRNILLDAFDRSEFLRTNSDYVEAVRKLWKA
jgi:8-oxo-dGTP diphosphatase